MAKPFSALPDVLSKREKQWLTGVNRIAQGAAREAGRVAAETTRVDTGLARSNWRATLGVPATTTIPPYAPGSKLGIGERGNLLGVQAQHAAVSATWDSLKGTPMFIANNVPYIAFLNFGGANFGPGNMLAQAGLAWVEFIKRSGRILR